ncbi:hypothetical protein ACWER6_31325 [Streptomyces sp. NPDC004009]
MSGSRWWRARGRSWRKTARKTAARSREPAPALPACRFEAAAYEAGIARAAEPAQSGGGL